MSPPAAINAVDRLRGHHAVVVGAGGNIGSQLVPILARWPEIESLTLIDRDVYETKNVSSQNISASDVGRAKAACQARQARRIRPGLPVRFHHADVERLPLGLLRGDVILACLDSRRSRQHVNEAARRLGIPWIDAGVEAQGMLARVKVYGVGEEHACLECAWDERDYELLEIAYGCQNVAGHGAPPTNAPASLGALAASLQAIECRKLLDGQGDPSSIDKEVLLDALHHRYYATRYRRNEQCRLGDHSCWPIDRLAENAGRLTLAVLMQRIAPRGFTADDWVIQCWGQRFVHVVVCPSCGMTRETFVTQRALLMRRRQCPRCRQPLVATGLHVADRARLSDIAPCFSKQPLASLGFAEGDVLTLTSIEATTHLEIGCDEA